MAKPKPGKYDHIINKLPRLMGSESPAFYAKVEAVKLAMKSEEGFKQWGSYIAKMYADIRRERDAISDTLSEANMRLEAVSQLLEEQFDNEGIKKVLLTDGSSVLVNREPTGRVTDQEAFRLWCITNGYERSLHMHPSKAVSVIKERMLVGEPDPDGIESGSRRKITFSNAE